MIYISSINLNELTKSGTKISNEVLLGKVHNKMASIVKTRKDNDFIILQQFLQSQFYGDSTTIENLVNKTSVALGNEYIQIENFNKLVDFNYDNVENIDSKKEIEKYIKDKYSASAITLKDIKNELDYVRSILNHLKNNPSDSKKIIELNKQIDKIYEDNIKKTYEQLDININNKKAILSKDQNLERLVEGLNEIHRIFEENLPGKKNSSKKLSTKDIGDIFEYGLAMCSKEFIGKTTSEIKDMASSQLYNTVTGYITAGTTKALIAGGKSAVLQAEYSYNFNDGYQKTVSKTTKKGKVSEYEIVVSENPKITIKVKDNGIVNYDIKKAEQRNGKMDVLYTLPNSKMKSFRVSAKNWSNTYGTQDNPRGFETKSLAYSIERTINRLNFYRYIFQIGSDVNNNDTSNIEIWHQLGKMSVISDALIGTTQSKGYADTLIINDRSKPLIIVVPMQSVINDIYDIISDENNFKGYDAQSINDSLQGIFKYHDQNKMTGTAAVISGRQYLKNLAVTLKYSAIKKYAIANKK